MLLLLFPQVPQWYVEIPVRKRPEEAPEEEEEEEGEEDRKTANYAGVRQQRLGSPRDPSD